MQVTLTLRMQGKMKPCAQDLNILPLILSGLFPRIDPAGAQERRRLFEMIQRCCGGMVQNLALG